MAGTCWDDAHVVQSLVEVVLDDELSLLVIFLEDPGLAFYSAQCVSLGVEGSAV